MTPLERGPVPRAGSRYRNDGSRGLERGPAPPVHRYGAYPAGPRHHAGVAPAPPLPENFWWLWTAGTFVPLAAAVLAGMSQDVPSGWAALFIVVGLGLLVGNIWLALASDGYRQGDLAVLGRVLALASGWSGAALVALAVAVVVVAIIVVVAVLYAVFAALGASDS